MSVINILTVSENITLLVRQIKFNHYPESVFANQTLRRVLFTGSVYSVVKTMLEAATERKCRKAEKNASSYSLTKRHRKTEKMPKENKSLITLNMTPNNPKYNP